MAPKRSALKPYLCGVFPLKCPTSSLGHSSRLSPNSRHYLQSSPSGLNRAGPACWGGSNARLCFRASARMAGEERALLTRGTGQGPGPPAGNLGPRRPDTPAEVTRSSMLFPGGALLVTPHGTGLHTIVD